MRAAVVCVEFSLLFPLGRLPDPTVRIRHRGRGGLQRIGPLVRIPRSGGSGRNVNYVPQIARIFVRRLTLSRPGQVAEHRTVVRAGSGCAV